jgi:hypothetical protein
MSADRTVVFDLSPTAKGAYYVAGDVVLLDGRVCVVQGTVRLDGTRFRAALRVVPHPTPEQRRAAEAWHRRMFPA